MRPVNRLLAGAAVLVVLVNAAVLTDVAWNRRGAPESVLTLSERELVVWPNSSSFYADDENSGMTLRLLWAVGAARGEVRGAALGSAGYGPWSPVPWLDRAKLATLGFEVARAPEEADAGERYRRMLGREVLLVLELNGPAYAAALARARERAAQSEASAAQQPDPGADTQHARRAREALEQQELKDTRLFVVDAGLDARALRARYPDRAHYAIVHGSVAIGVDTSGPRPTLYGRIAALRCANINVPQRWHATLPATFEPFGAPRAPFQVVLAFGQRLEPWIVSAGGPGGG